jgi:hypothetical protein
MEISLSKRTLENLTPLLGRNPFAKLVKYSMKMQIIVEKNALSTKMGEFTLQDGTHYQYISEKAYY